MVTRFQVMEYGGIVDGREVWTVAEDHETHEDGVSQAVRSLLAKLGSGGLVYPHIGDEDD